MIQINTLIGIFDSIDPVVRALDRLQELGIPEDRIELISGLPFASRILGRPAPKVWLPQFSPAMALLGFLIGAFFAIVTPNLYVIRVGHQPVVPIPTTLIILFELTMLFLIIGSFAGFLLFNEFPTHQPTYYEPSISDERIGIIVHCETSTETENAEVILETEGAQTITHPERRAL